MRFAATVAFALAWIGASVCAMAEEKWVEINTLQQLAQYAAKSGNSVRLAPGVYRMSEYLSDEVIEQIRKDVPGPPGRPPIWMMRFDGDNNRFDLSGVVLEIDTELYAKLPRGYTRCLFVSGAKNTFDGLTIRNTGPNKGSNGNILSVWGNGNTLQNISLFVYGSSPYGYGDLLGKGGPGLVGLQKQSGIMVAGHDNTIRRCRVISRAFGHCFYIQRPSGMTTDNIRLEDCYAEGVIRSTNDMLRETSGLAFDLKFRSIYENRDGRYLMTSGYMKSLCEDGFRTYGGVGRISLVNCVAINTRAGFEIAGSDEGDQQTVIENATALGCERGYLIGSNVRIRNSRGDVAHGPLLYLRGGRNSDVELALSGGPSVGTVHALATIAGKDHRVRLFTHQPEQVGMSLPIMLGFGMPDHAEMASPIRPASAINVTLLNELPRMTVLKSEQSADCTIETGGLVVTDEETRAVYKPK